MPSMWLTKTRSMRAEGPIDRKFAMREMYRAWVMLGGLLKSYKPSQTICDQCGKRVGHETPRPKLCRLITEHGKEKARRLWQEGRRSRKGIQVETFVGDHKLVHVVCSEKCLAMARQSNRETEECLMMIRDGKLQIRAIQRFLKTGRLDALSTLPPELGPEHSSQAS